MQVVHHMNCTELSHHAHSLTQYYILLQLEMDLVGWTNVPRTAYLEHQRQLISCSLETKLSLKLATHGSILSWLTQWKASDSYFSMLDALKADENVDWCLLSLLAEQMALVSSLSVPTLGYWLAFSVLNILLVLLSNFSSF